MSITKEEDDMSKIMVSLAALTFAVGCFGYSVTTPDPFILIISTCGSLCMIILAIFDENFV